MKHRWAEGSRTIGQTLVNSGSRKDPGQIFIRTYFVRALARKTVAEVRKSRKDGGSGKMGMGIARVALYNLLSVFFVRGWGSHEKLIFE